MIKGIDNKRKTMYNETQKGSGGNEQKNGVCSSRADLSCLHFCFCGSTVTGGLLMSRWKCTGDCFNCKLPVEKCHGGDRSKTALPWRNSAHAETVGKGDYRLSVAGAVHITKGGCKDA